MKYDAIRYEIAGNAAVITLNRPDRMNALNTQMRAEITHAVKAGGEATRVVVITGEGRAFCSGQDLGNAAENANDIDLEGVLRREYIPMVTAIQECPVPVVAAVNGAAAGAGANLALAADVVIAAESAFFMQAFTRIGLLPDAGGTWFLPRLIGHARAMGTSLFADRITARQALEWGMIWEVTSDEEFENIWKARARHIATGPRVAYSAIKQALTQTGANSLDAQMLLEARLQGRCGQSNDFKAGIIAFNQKRAPKFEGR